MPSSSTKGAQTGESKMPQKRNLIVVRSGHHSLHEQWLRGAEPDFDLVVTFYGNEIPADWAKSAIAYQVIPIKGSKWKGLHHYFTTTNEWRTYDRILAPDDDLAFDAATANRFFDVATQLQADLCQPALDEKSYFSHLVTLRHGRFRYRTTNFVEMMCPCFSKRMLETTLPLFNESESGWGLDVFWTDLIVQNGFIPPVIIDETPITHTRPIGAAGHGSSGALTPGEELRMFMQKFGLGRREMVTTGGRLLDGTDVSVEKNPFRLTGAVLAEVATKVGRTSMKKLRRNAMGQIRLAVQNKASAFGRV